MSEATPPFNRPDQPESVDSSPLDSHRSLPDPSIPSIEVWEVSGEQDAVTEEDRFAGEEENNPFLQHGASGEIPPIASPSPSVPADSVTMAPGSEAWLSSPETTDLADLISLIQELNQCNSILLDRVSQLEEALERSQSALKAEVKRSQSQVAFSDYEREDLVSIQDLTAAQEQVVELYNQLEFVHQTNQRQQILVETLTGQLEASQERVAQLEREAALVQQRYNDQMQSLIQYEHNCRDLQARLHRQQRYTLQFKAALEKSLEVSAPPFESVAQAVAAASTEDYFFLPKGQRIQPWISPAAAEQSWMKVSAAMQGEELAEQTELNEVAETEIFGSESANISVPLPEIQPIRRTLAAVKLPGFGNPLPQPSQRVAEPNMEAQSSTELQSVSAASPSTNVSYNLKQEATAPQANGAPIQDEQLMQKLDAAVQPIADMLAQVMLGNTQAEASHLGMLQPGTTSSTGVPEVGGPDQFTDYLAADPETVSSENESVANSDELLNAVMADAEDALWQDLARLIDVSTEDVVKASLSGDLSAFESINFDTLPPAELNQPDPREADPWTEAASPAANASQPLKACPSPGRSSSEPALASTESLTKEPAEKEKTATSVPALESSSWPAPLVHPLRPAKKRRSLAAVELPSFLQPQEPGIQPT
ncbi:MAG: hypothetical protein Kow00121_03370 [Elainellaceae cyanobacterium]